MQRAFWIVLGLGCGVLLAYSLYRMVNLSFVHDESLSFTIAMGDPSFRLTANQHPLNTRAMEWALHWFGDREWSLRLPNLIAHALYLTAGMLFLRKLKSKSAILLGFGLLNLNPFLLDFFSLARGYGIACSFSLAAICLLREGWDRVGTAAGRGFLVLSFTFAALADLANFAWVNLHFAMLGAAIIFLIADIRTTAKRAHPVIFAAVFLGANAWSLVNVGRRVISLQRRGEFYAGGETGFVQDTLGSLVQGFFYDGGYSEASAVILAYCIVALIIIIGVWLTFKSIRDRHVSFSAMVFAVLVLAMLAPISEHILLGALFPRERAALYYVPLFGVTMASAADHVSKFVGIRRRVSSLIGVVLTTVLFVHFGRNANLTHTLLWSYDADTKTAMSDLDVLFRKSPHRVTIGNFWKLEPSINYYRLTRQLDWLEPANRILKTPTDRDILFCYPDELGDAQLRYSLIKQYPHTGLGLFMKQ